MHEQSNDCPHWNAVSVHLQALTTLRESPKV